jgi:hypothetical protein
MNHCYWYLRPTPRRYHHLDHHHRISHLKGHRPPWDQERTNLPYSLNHMRKFLFQSLVDLFHKSSRSHLLPYHMGSNNLCRARRLLMIQYLDLRAIGLKRRLNSIRSCCYRMTRYCLKSYSTAMCRARKHERTNHTRAVFRQDSRLSPPDNRCSHLMGMQMNYHILPEPRHVCKYHHIRLQVAAHG